MSNTSIYSAFGCINKDEFQQKLESSTDTFEEIFPLAKSYNDHYADLRPIQFTSAYDVKDVIERYSLYPNKNECVILQLDGRNELLEATVFQSINDIGEAISQPLTASFVGICKYDCSRLELHELSKRLDVHCNDFIYEFEGYLASVNSFMTDMNEARWNDTISSDELLSNCEKLNSQIIYKHRLDTLDDYYECSDLLKEHFLTQLEKSSLLITDKKVEVLLQDSFRYAPNEYVVGIYYDKNRIIQHVDILGTGNLSASIVDTRRIQHRLKDKDIRGFMIAHNHPSGKTKPSDEDKMLTNTINQITKQLKKELLAHVIVGKNKSHCLDNEGYPIDPQTVVFTDKTKSVKEKRRAYTNGLLSR